MPQEKFHRRVEYRIFAEGGEEPRGHMEYVDRRDHATVPRFRPDDVLYFKWKYGIQQRFRDDVNYEIEGPGAYGQGLNMWAASTSMINQLLSSADCGVVHGSRHN